MVRVHTAQLNVGRKIPRYSNVLFLDTTVKSAESDLEKALAPPKALVNAYKYEGLDPKDYSAGYLKHLDNIEQRFKRLLKYLATTQPFNEIVVACYCGKDKFCHRHLLQRWLVDNFELSVGFEVLNSDIESTAHYNGSTVSLIEPTPESVHAAMNAVKAEIDKGEIEVLSTERIEQMCEERGKEVDVESDCSLTQSLVSCIVLSEVFTVKTKDTSRGYLDVSGRLSGMFKKMRCFSPIESTMLKGYPNIRRCWRDLDITPEMQPKDIRNEIMSTCQYHLVTLKQSYKNVDLEASMDTHYQMAK